MKHEFFVWTEIVCQYCARTSCGSFSTKAIQRHKILKEATRRGWQTDGREWTCNDCVAEIKRHAEMHS